MTRRPKRTLRPIIIHTKNFHYIGRNVLWCNVLEPKNVTYLQFESDLIDFHVILIRLFYQLNYSRNFLNVSSFEYRS